MNMFKKGFVISIVLIILVVMPLLVACNDETAPEITIALNPKEIQAIYNPVAINYMLAIPVVENAYHYKISVYPRGDLQKCLLTQTADAIEDAANVTFILQFDVIKWQYLDVYVVAYSYDYLVSSDVVEVKLTCSIEEDDIVIADEREAGVIDGYEDTSYYYANVEDITHIVKPIDDIDYALIVDDINNIDSIEMPFMFNDCYSLDIDNGTIIIKKECFNSYELGALIPIEITYKDSTKYNFNIAIVAALTPTLKDLSFQRGYASDIVYDCLKSDSDWSLAGVLFDGVRMPLEAYTNTSTQVTIKAAFLNKLSLGTHVFRVYYKVSDVFVGYSESVITVDTSISKAPYNLTLSYDDTYPAVKVTWDVDYSYREAVLYVNDVPKLSSINQAALFDGNSITITNYIKHPTDKVQIYIKYSDGTEFRSDAAYLDYDMDSHIGKESYFTDTVSYIGKSVNSYISSEDELNDYVAYRVNHFSDNDHIRYTQWDGSETWTIYSPYLVNKYQTESKLISILNKSFDVYIEPVVTNISSLTVDDNVITAVVNVYSGSTRPYESRITDYDYTTNQYEEYPYSELHYYTNGESTRSSTYEGFKVNNIQKTATVSTSLELLLALEAGYKPLPVANSNADKIYTRAKNTLREIIDDKMSDYEKVLAIYDWMTYNVIFDRGIDNAVANKCGCTDKTGYSRYRAIYKSTSFYAEGVFFYGIAVCNGIGSAFSILANIEGIPAIKTMGKAAGGSHTWVKVYVNDEWFVCDPSWSNAVDLKDEGKHQEYISYDFFMMSNDESKYKSRSEFEDKIAYNYYAGNTVFDYYSNEAVVYDNKLATKNVKSIEKFTTLFNYYLDSLDSGDEIQFSIEMEKKKTILDINSSATTIQTWIDNYIVLPSGSEVRVFSRKTTSTTYVEEYNNIVYIRIKKG